MRVESDPPGATIYVDRKDLGGLGQTPRTLALPHRPCTILLELAGHESGSQAVTPTVGAQVTVKLALPTIYGQVRLQISPPDAAVRLDAQDGPLLRDGAQVVPGWHVLWVSAPGHVSQNLSIDVPAKASVNVSAQLLMRPPPTGVLVAQSNVDGALVTVDGQARGFTPGVIDGIGVGTHQVTLSAEGRAKVTRTVEIAEGQRAFVQAKLAYTGPEVEAATKTLARASDAPGSITVISREELQAFGYQTVAEALRAVRGVYLSDDRTYTSLGFRGISPLGDFNNRVLILVDGHTVYDPWVDQAYVGRELDVDLANVERIEVVRGGGSALYGTGALFGVINVVYRKAAPGLHAEVEGGLESLGAEQGRVTGSYANAHFSILATAAAYDASGQAVYQAPEPTFGKSLAVGNDGERAFHAGLRVRAGDFSLLAELNDRRKDSPVGQYDVVFGQAQRSVDGLGFVEGRFEHGFGGGLQLTARAYYDGSRFTGRYPLAGAAPGTLETTLDTGGADAVGGEVRLRLPELWRNTVSVGAEVQDRFRVYQTSATAGVFELHDPHLQEQIVSAYLNDAVRIFSRLSLVAGARVDDHLDSFGVVFTPRAALIGHFYEGATTKLMASRSFRAPSLYERFYEDGVTQVQARDLRPEVGQSVELEHTHPLGDSARVTVGVFYSELSNLIDLGTLPNGLLQYQNEPGVIHTLGVEAEARYQPGPHLLLELNYAYQHSRAADGSVLDNSPAHTGAARVMVPVYRDLLTLATEGVYDSARTAPPDDQGVRRLVGEGLHWNAVVSGFYAKYRLRYTAGVYNLLDQRVELPASGMPAGVNVAQLGRTFRITLAADF